MPSPSTTHSVVSYRLCVVFREYYCSFHTFTLSLHCPGSRHGKKLLFDPSVLCCVCYDPHSPCDFTCQVDGCDTGYHHGCLRGNLGWYKPLHRRKLEVHKNTHFANTFVCPHCVFTTVMGLPADPDNDVHVQCLQAEHARQVFVCQARAVSTTNNLHYATRRLFRFGDILTANAAHEVRAAPDPAHPYADPVATAWHLCFRARTVPGQTGAKVQTLKGNDRSAISACYRKSGLATPWQLAAHPAWKSELGELLVGMSNVLGEPGERSPALSFDVILEANTLLWKAVDSASHLAGRLDALLDVCSFDMQVLAFCRPGEPYLLSLYAMHKHLFIGKRAEARGCQPYVGISWRTSEAGTKTNPTARSYNVDGHNACAVMLATTKSGFRTGEAVSEVLRAWGIDPEGTWPHPPGPWSAVPFFRSIDGSTWNSVDFLHNCLRPTLLHLQRRGMGDLNGLDLSVVYGYSLKNSGVTLAASRGVEKYLRNGHGRWLLLSSNPPEMVERYVQASLDDKLTVSNV